MKKLESMTYQELYETCEKANRLLDNAKKLFFWSLTYKESQIYQLRKIENRTWKEICMVTGLSFLTAKNIYKQALDKIDERERLKELVPKSIRYVPSNDPERNFYIRKTAIDDGETSQKDTMIRLVVNNEIERGDFTSIRPNYQELSVSDILDYDSEVWMDGKVYTFPSLSAIKRFIDSHIVLFKDSHLAFFGDAGWDILDRKIDIYDSGEQGPNTLVYTISCNAWRNDI